MTIDELRRIARLSYYKAIGDARLDEKLELYELLIRWKKNEDSKFWAKPDNAKAER